MSKFPLNDIEDSRLGAFHLVRTHLGGEGGGVKVSYTFPLRITCKKKGGGGGGRGSR